MPVVSAPCKEACIPNSHIQIDNIHMTDERDEHQVLNEKDTISIWDSNIARLLGPEYLKTVKAHIIQKFGRYPPLDAFPLLDAFTLCPYHRFSDLGLYDVDLRSLVCPNYCSHGKL